MGRALLGWIVLCAGIGLAISTARFAAGLTSAPAAAVPLLQALLVTALVVPVILLLRSKVDRKSAADLGLSRRMLTPVIFGLTVGVASGAATWLPALWMGWISIERVDYGTLMSFLVINAFVLLLYEALPEELALRGYAWANLRSRWSPLIATWIVTVLFIFSSSLISVFQFGSARLLDVEPVGLGWAPAGTDPVAYVLQLGLFGLVLCAARRVPVAGALGIAIAFHLAQLTVTRLVLGGLGWLDSGIDVEFTAPDAIALVLVHICLGGFMFILTRKWLQRRDTVTEGNALMHRAGS
ncbi:CPBP family intramembrane metalloprotease [Arthrobacter sp. zg-ZUI10]|nr:CPBP family intramembrane metalloprotease [Arthrobacter sunyaminii]